MANDPMAVLQRILQPPPGPPPGKRCELCSADISDEHDHVVDIDSRSLLCACRGCALLFPASRGKAGRYRSVPDRCQRLDGFTLSSAQWDDLQIPVGLAFFFHHSELERTVAFYPGPAGATESLLELDAWAAIEAANAHLKTLLPDVEALLLRRDDESRFEPYLVPIDACYELVGLLRLNWKGFDGGQEAREAIEGFFERIEARSKPVDATTGEACA